jgi:hypothetical protein
MRWGRNSEGMNVFYCNPDIHLGVPPANEKDILILVTKGISPIYCVGYYKDMDGIGSGSCQMVGFGISGIEASGSSARLLVSQPASQSVSQFVF